MAPFSQDLEPPQNPGRFMVDQSLDLTGLLERIGNDASGAPAYDPAELLKIVLQGIQGSH
jgi:hypothetical protein